MDKSTPKPKTVMKKTQTCNIHFRTNNFFFVDNYYNVQLFLFLFLGDFVLCFGVLLFLWHYLYFLLFYLFFNFFFIFYGCWKKNHTHKASSQAKKFRLGLKTPDTHRGFLSSETNRRDQSPWILVWEYRPTKLRRQGRLSKGETYWSNWKCQNVGLAHNEKC